MKKHNWGNPLMPAFRKKAGIRIINWFEKCKGLSNFDWIVYIAIIFFYFISFVYGDVTTTAAHGFNLLDCIFNGDPLNFYDYALDHLANGQAPVYSFGIYILFTFFELPLWIISKAINVNVLLTPWGLSWYDCAI